MSQDSVFYNVTFARSLKSQRKSLSTTNKKNVVDVLIAPGALALEVKMATREWEDSLSDGLFWRKRSTLPAVTSLSQNLPSSLSRNALSATLELLSVEPISLALCTGLTIELYKHRYIV